MIQSTPSSTGALWARFRFSVVGSLLSSPPARGALQTTIRFHRPRSVGEEHLLRIEGDHGETLISRPPGTVMGERNRKRCIHPSHGG